MISIRAPSNSLLAAGHQHNSCSTVFSSSMHSQHFASWARLIVFIWCLNLQWSISRPIRAITCDLVGCSFLLSPKDRNKHFRDAYAWKVVKMLQPLFYYPGNYNALGITPWLAEYRFWPNERCSWCQGICLFLSFLVRTNEMLFFGLACFGSLSSSKRF